jgi:hypothetical protein
VAAEALARLGADATKAAPGGDGGRSETQPPTDGGREVERKEPPGIAEVKSLAELRKCPPALREGGWELRLGLGDGGEAASDWRLLYCLASYVGHEAKPGSPKPVERMFGSASPLGPVSYRAREAGAQSEMEVQVRPNRVASVYVGQYGRRGEFVEELYSGTVPLVGKRDIRVQVFSRDIKLIAETVLPLKEEPPHHWQRLLAPQDDKGEGPPCHPIVPSGPSGRPSGGTRSA